MKRHLKITRHSGLSEVERPRISVFWWMHMVPKIATTQIEVILGEAKTLSFSSLYILALLVALFAVGARSRAQTPAVCGANASSTISTDRPQITNASTVVPCGSLQFENGF